VIYWFQAFAFKCNLRHYTVEGVGARQARKLWQLLKQAKDKRGHLNTFGMLDPVQVTQSAKYLSTAYVSGWQCSSTASTSNEPGPDFADYPMDTVPNKVDHLVRAQLFHDRKQKVARAQMPEQDRSVRGTAPGHRSPSSEKQKAKRRPTTSVRDHHPCEVNALLFLWGCKLACCTCCLALLARVAATTLPDLLLVLLLDSL
jgi:hypothetical protein